MHDGLHARVPLYGQTGRCHRYTTPGSSAYKRAAGNRGDRRLTNRNLSPDIPRWLAAHRSYIDATVRSQIRNSVFVFSGRRSEIHCQEIMSLTLLEANGLATIQDS